jgi:hypothetical protein
MLGDALARPERLEPLGARARQAARGLRWDAVLAQFESILVRTIQHAPAGWHEANVAGG